MFWRLLLLFVGLPTLELFILYLMMNVLGTITTFLLIFVTGLVGAFLVRYQGMSCWIELHRQLDCSGMPTQLIAEEILILIAGILLITPGPITDLVGFLLLLPPVRRAVVAYAFFRFEMYRLRTRQRPSTASNETIDV